MKEVTESIVREVDAKYQTPMSDYKFILGLIQDDIVMKTLSPRQLANFASHFLTGFFDHGSKEWKMANALMANVYYYHYVSLMNEPIETTGPEGDGTP